MTRFGKLFLALLVLAAAAFAALVRFRDVPPIVAESSLDALPPAPGGTALAIPVRGVRAADLRDTFADPRGGHVHGALDIMAPRGTPVLAAHGGTVEKLFESKAGGHTLYLRSPDGRTITYYAHLDGYAPGIAEGRYVTQGTPIATVGSTGDADPAAPHLHFEVKAMRPGERWWQGRAVNPYTLLGPGTSGEGWAR